MKKLIELESKMAFSYKRTVNNNDSESIIADNSYFNMDNSHTQRNIEVKTVL